MNRKWMALFVACIACTSVSHAGFWDAIKSVFPKHVHLKPVGVRVLLMNSEEGAMVGVKGKYKIYDPNTKELISTRFVGKTKYMEAMGSGIKWREEFPGIHQLLIVSDDPSGFITVNDTEYKGSIYVYGIDGKISIVNEVPVEEYLAGLLAGQFHDKMDEETLAAIAIAARTEVLYQLEHPRSKYWTVEAAEVGYKGQDSVNPSSLITHAVSETHGMVMSLGNDDSRHFPAKWETSLGAEIKTPAVFSKITVEQADEMARSGQDALDILAKAFPHAKLNLSR